MSLADKVSVEAAALVALARKNIPVDVQELLIQGNPLRDIAPGALFAAISNALSNTSAGVTEEQTPRVTDADDLLPTKADLAQHVRNIDAWAEASLHSRVAPASEREEETPCPVCGNEERGQGGYLSCECPAPASQKEAVAVDTEWLARASVSIADMVDDWYRSLTVKGTASIPPDLVMRRLERFAPAPAGEPGISERLYDPDEPMADGEIRMTAAENVLGWLLIEKIGVPDDRNYSPNEAQEILVRRLDYANEMENERIRSALHPTPTPVSAPVGVVEDEERSLLYRLNACAERLEGLETLPKPYDLYYAVKSEGDGTGWRYCCAGIGVSDIREALTALRSPAVEGK